MRLLICALLAIRVVHAEPGPWPREVRVDDAGDRLPDGAFARFGTTRYRELSATRLHVTTDRTQVIASDQHNVRVWDAATGQRLHEWPLPESFRGVVTPDGQRALHLTEANRDQAGGVEIWDVPQQKRLHRFTINGVGRLQAVAMHPNGTTVATVDDTPREHRVRLWDLRTGKDRVIGAVDFEVHSLHFVHEGQRLLVNPAIPENLDDQTESVICFDTTRDVEAYRIKDAHVLRVSDDGESLIATVAWQPRHYRAKDGACLNVWKKLAVRVPEHVLAFSTALERVVVPDAFRVTMVQQLQPWVDGHRVDGRFTAAAFVPRTGSDEATVWLAGAGLCQVGLAANGRTLRGPVNEHGLRAEPTAFSWSPDGSLFLMKNEREQLTFNARTRTALRQEATRWFEPGLSFTPLPMARSEADRLRQPRLRLAGEYVGPVHLTPSPDGQLVAVREVVGPSQFRHVHLHERCTGQRIVSLTIDVVGDIGFNAASNQLATVEPSGFRVWNVHDGKQCFQRTVPTVGRLPRGQAFGRGVAFSPDQRLLAIGHRDGTVILWSLPIPEPTKKWTDTDGERLWPALAADAPDAWRAVMQLRDDPARSVPLMLKHLKPVQPLSDAVAKQLLAELDSPTFRVREQAMSKILGHGDAAKAFVDQAKREATSADMLKRLDILQANFGPARPALGEDIRALRALAVLWPFTQRDDVRTHLATIARGLPDAHVTKEAQRMLTAAKKD